MYVGQLDVQSVDSWVLKPGKKIMEKKKLQNCPALLKIFDEILVNAADNHQRDRRMNKIEIDVGEKKEGLNEWEISVRNNGAFIPIEKHEKEDLYIPELIFGHLLTGSNFDDSASRLTGGSHGYGAKLTNIFSTRFQIETYDHKQRLLYSQVWTDNMRKCGPPELSKLKVKDQLEESFTRVVFRPDLTKFGDVQQLEGRKRTKFLKDMELLFQKRALEIAACISPTKVLFNGKPLPVNSFLDFVKLHSSKGKEIEEAKGKGLKEEADEVILYEKLSSRWEVAVKQAKGGFEAVSFVNNVCTPRGGTHVTAITSQIVKAFEAALERGRSNGSSVPSTASKLIKNKLMVFVNCHVENPQFEGQTKDALSTKAGDFGSSCVLSKAFLNQVVQDTGILESISEEISSAERKRLLAFTKGTKKQQQLIDVPKLEDAHKAGTTKALDCTLILTEGDSAKALAVAGLEVTGRETYGVLPLRGKLLNVRVAGKDQLAKNAEFANLCKALGLSIDKDYAKGLKGQGLRYRSVMIMADQDSDGSHIKGLIINLFHHFWPNLLKNEGFLQQFMTPIVKVKDTRVDKKAKNGKTNTGDNMMSFFSLPEYDEWRRGLSEVELKHYRVKYYKGLGTNTAAEGRQYFSDLHKHRKNFSPLLLDSSPSADAIDLAFSKTRAADRRRWLEQHYDPEGYLDPYAESVTYEDFINKELIHFSYADNSRSIPNVIDGLKPSQRKVLYGCLKRNLKEETKVVQVAGYIAEHTAYHHGEASLHATIINMAQDFVGANNVPLLLGSGQFGTRAEGGKDHASPRYIFTQLSPLTRLLIPEPDDELLEYQEEDGQLVEPRFFLPVVPLLLLNGSTGIGTGWSTNVPSFNLADIVENLFRRLDGKPPKIDLKPFIRGFTGTVESDPGGKGTYVSSGVAKQVDETTIEVSELPFGRWTNNYKEVLCGMVREEKLKSFKEYHTSDKVRFVLKTPSTSATAALTYEGNSSLLKELKLQTKISLDNMHAFDANGSLVKYVSAEEVVDAHFKERFNGYEQRKEREERRFTADELVSRKKSEFIQHILRGEISLLRPSGGSGVSEQGLVETLEKRGFPSSTDIHDIREGTSSTKKKKGVKTYAGRGDYSYLVDMPIQSLTEGRSVALQQAAEVAKTRLVEMRARSAEDLWRADLTALMDAYGK